MKYTSHDYFAFDTLHLKQIKTPVNGLYEVVFYLNYLKNILLTVFFQFLNIFVLKKYVKYGKYPVHYFIYTFIFVL